MELTLWQMQPTMENVPSCIATVNRCDRHRCAQSRHWLGRRANGKYAADDDSSHCIRHIESSERERKRSVECRPQLCSVKLNYVTYFSHFTLFDWRTTDVKLLAFISRIDTVDFLAASDRSRFVVGPLFRYLGNLRLRKLYTNFVNVVAVIGSRWTNVDSFCWRKKILKLYNWIEFYRGPHIHRGP